MQKSCMTSCQADQAARLLGAILVTLVVLLMCVDLMALAPTYHKAALGQAVIDKMCVGSETQIYLAPLWATVSPVLNPSVNLDQLLQKTHSPRMMPQALLSARICASQPHRGHCLLSATQHAFGDSANKPGKWPESLLRCRFSSVAIALPSR
jgi:hypothetical protein